jgi:hypothetical protein
MTYPAKSDWWVRYLLVPLWLLMAAVGLVALALTALGEVPAVPGLVDGVLLAAAGLLMLWMFAATSYEITDTALVARLGPFRRTVPLAAIEEVVATRRFHLMAGMGLAWSLDMLHVRHRKPSGRRALPVAISPADKEGFLRELTGRVPGLTVVDRDGPPPGPAA